MSETLQNYCDISFINNSVIFFKKSQFLYNFSEIVTVKLFDISLQFLYNNLVQFISACIQCIFILQTHSLCFSQANWFCLSILFSPQNFEIHKLSILLNIIHPERCKDYFTSLIPHCYWSKFNLLF